MTYIFGVLMFSCGVLVGWIAAGYTATMEDADDCECSDFDGR